MFDLIVGRTMKDNDDESKNIVVRVEIEGREVIFTSPNDKDLYLVVSEKQLREFLK